MGGAVCGGGSAVVGCLGEWCGAVCGGGCDVDDGDGLLLCLWIGGHYGGSVGGGRRR